MRWICVIGALFVLAGCFGQGELQADEGQLSFRTLDVGQSSGLRQDGVRVIEDQEEWMSLWQEHANSSGIITQDGHAVGDGREPPAVDFARELVVAASIGERSNTCYHVRVVLTDATAERVHLTIREYLPPEPATCGLTTVHPFHFVAVARGGAVELDHQVVHGTPFD